MNTELFQKAYGAIRNGANFFVRHPLVGRFAYSDGVQECAECGLYWMLDILATELPAAFRANVDVSNQCIVEVVAKGSKAQIRAEFEDGVLAWKRDIGYTDLPDGTWQFLVADDGGPTPYRMCLISEY